MFTLYNDDFLKVDVGVVDFILTDIPYNIGRDAYASNPKWWKGKDFRNGKSELANSEFFEGDSDFNIGTLLCYIKDHLKENSSAIIFCSFEQQFEIINLLKKYNFKKYIPLVFVKNNSSEVLKSNMRICGACEYGLQIFNGKLGKYNNNKKMVKNWFNFTRQKNTFHPNQKPVDLLEQFILLFTDEGETVLDMCMGSASTGIACLKQNRAFIGIEKDSDFFAVALKRIIDFKNGESNE